VNNGPDFYYECAISGDVLWLLYCKENEVIQDCPKLRDEKDEIEVKELLDKLTPNQRRIISAVCKMTEQKGASISVESVMNAVYKFEERPESESFGKNVRTISNKFASVGQELLFKFRKDKIDGGVIVSYVEKVKKNIDTSSEGGVNKAVADTSSKGELSARHTNYENSTNFISNAKKPINLNDEKDAYYLKEIKGRAILLYDDNRTRTMNVLHNHLFFMRKELSDMAKEEIDLFFATEFVTELIRQGLNEELAQWYSDLWYLWCMRQLYKEKFEKAKAEQDYERMDMARRHSNRYEDAIDALIERIEIYNNSLENGGRI